MSSPPWVRGYVPTAAEWNAALAGNAANGQSSADSATAAAASAVSASASAATATTGASTATTQAGGAASSAAAAAASATAAAGSSSTAATAQTSATSSASAAATSATNAASSATNAASSATNAATSATNAATYATGFSIGTVTTLASGSSATATISGAPGSQHLNIGIPQGATGGSGGYTLPAATPSSLGGVQIGSNISNTSGTISLSGVNVVTALGSNPTFVGSATFPGSVNATASFQTNDTTAGSIQIARGGSTTTGLISFYNTAGTRAGYIGYAAPASMIPMQAENGYLGYQVNENFGVTGVSSFTGAATFANSAAVSGALSGNTVTAAAGFVATTGDLSFANTFGLTQSNAAGAWVQNTSGSFQFKYSDNANYFDNYDNGQFYFRGVGGAVGLTIIGQAVTAPGSLTVGGPVTSVGLRPASGGNVYLQNSAGTVTYVAAGDTAVNGGPGVDFYGNLKFLNYQSGGFLGTDGAGNLITGGFVTPQMYRLSTDADDTNSLQLAVNSGKPVQLVGSFTISAPVTFNAANADGRGCCILGGGVGLSRIVVTNAAAPLIFEADYSGQIVLKDFAVQSAVANAATAIQIIGQPNIGSVAPNANLSNVVVEAAGGTFTNGILLQDVRNFHLAGVNVQGSNGLAGSGIIWSATNNGSTGNAPCDSNFDGCHVTGFDKSIEIRKSGDTGQYVSDDIQGVHVTGCTLLASNYGVYGTSLEDTAVSVIVTGNTFAQNAACVYLSNYRMSRVTNNHLQATANNCVGVAMLDSYADYVCGHVADNVFYCAGYSGCVTVQTTGSATYSKTIVHDNMTIGTASYSLGGNDASYAHNNY